MTFHPIKIMVAVFLCCQIFVNVAQAQRIEARVKLNNEKLSEEKKRKLADFAEKIEHFINSHDWSDNEWQTIVAVDIELLLEDISTGAEERYNAQILIHNNYDLQYFDKRWRFAYQSGDDIMYIENDKDSFTSVIEFYLYIILGGEYDKWGTLAGTRYFEKAKHIAEMARSGMGRFVYGWDRRLDLLEELMSDFHKPYREMVDYYFYGLSLVNQDNEKARRNCATAIKMLDKILTDDPENEYAQKFIQAHHLEIIEIFKRAINKDALRTLMVIDNDAARKRLYEGYLRD